MPEYIDIHSHLNFPNYNSDREEVIKRMNDQKVWTITVGTNGEDSKEAVMLAHKHKHLFATAGIHPTNNFTQNEKDEIVELAKNKKVMAIGECGLDFYRSPDDLETKKKQRKLFGWHIELALETGKPLMIHCRNAYKDVHEILLSYKKEYGDKLRGNMHFFAGNTEEAKLFLNLGFTLSFAGPITFARDYNDVIKFAPLDKIMSETDAPFAAPAPYRGKRNEPTYIAEIVKSVASIRDESLETVKGALVSNAIRCFRLIT